MAKILKRYDPPKRRGPKTMYPYDDWLDGKTRRLKAGEDFQCTQESIEGLIRDAAKARYRTVHIWHEDGAVVVQARPNRDLKS